MSISAGTVGEVRAAGSDTSGGLFYAAQPAAGTDYSQQNSPQLSLTDVVTNGTATVTSVTGGFTALMIGNGINIAGVAYMIATRSNTNTITVDRVIGAAVGQTGKVGGAWGSPGFAAGALSVGSCTIWIKAGTYTLTSATPNVSGGSMSLFGGSAAFPYIVRGYQATRGDNGTKPVISDGGFASQVIATAGTFCIIDNVEISAANAGSQLIYLNDASSRAIRCKVGGAGDGITIVGNSSAILCEASGCANGFNGTTPSYFFGCVSHGCSNHGFTVSAGSPVSVYEHCIAYGNGGSGFAMGNARGVIALNCTAYGNTADGFNVSSTAASIGNHLVNCLSVSNTGYGFNAGSASAFVDLINCATYNNTSGAFHLLSLTDGAVALTGNPFVNAAGGNFALNSTTGAGAAARAAGTPGAFPGALTTGYLDIGAAQHQDTGGGGGGTSGPAVTVVNRMPS